MCCYRPSEEQMRQMEQERRQRKVLDDLAAAIDGAELPEVKGVTTEGKKNDGVPGMRNTRLNG